FCPRSQAMEASTCGNTPEILDIARHSKRNRETDPTEFLCLPDGLTKPSPMCTTREERFLHRLLRAYTATVFLPASECSAGLLRDFRLSAKPSISGSGPKRPQALLHKHSRSAK